LVLYVMHQGRRGVNGPASWYRQSPHLTYFVQAKDLKT
jgi:hypothetical protein